MYRRKEIMILGSVAVLIMFTGLQSSYRNIEAMIVEKQPESVQVTQIPELFAELPELNREYDISRNRDTYNRGDADREYDFEPDMDFAGNDLEQIHVDSKLRVGDKGEEVQKLQLNLKKMGFFEEEATGFFGIVTNDAVVDFQVQMGIMPDGIVGTETLKKIDEAVEKGVTAIKPQPKQKTEEVQSTQKSSTPVPSVNAAQTTLQEQPSKGGKVELLSWFDGAENVFSIGSVATVLDVDTGISFKIKRTYGYNHADVETLTAEDTATLKKIAGGFNWTRRAVIVEVNGRRIAASMAPMPHAGLDNKPANAQVSNRSGDYGTGDNLDTVKGNDMDGHFDIHFYNSRTHGTNKVDSNHQAMVQKAYRSGK